MKAHKEIEQIEKILEKLKEKLDTIQTKIDEREETFGNRSDKWQESDKGIAFEEATTELQDLHLDIEDKIETIESALEELREITE
jgi:uncharacterized protein YukE